MGRWDVEDIIEVDGVNIHDLRVEIRNRMEFNSVATP